MVRVAWLCCVCCVMSRWQVSSLGCDLVCSWLQVCRRLQRTFGHLMRHEISSRMYLAISVQDGRFAVVLCVIRCALATDCLARAPGLRGPIMPPSLGSGQWLTNTAQRLDARHCKKSATDVPPAPNVGGSTSSSSAAMPPPPSQPRSSQDTLWKMRYEHHHPASFNPNRASMICGRPVQALE